MPYRILGGIVLVYLDNAATTGQKPPTVRRAVADALINFSANPGRSGHAFAQRAGEMVYKTREKTAKFFGAETGEVIFTQNCTHSINMAIKGSLMRGDHVIISSMEHNAVIRPIHTLKNNEIINYDIAQVIHGDDDATVRSFERLINEKTRMIICVHGSNVTGEILPIKRIGEICKKRNITFVVDAAQTAGIIPIDCKESGIDFLCIAPHKGLYSPMGLGVLIARKPVLRTITEGGTGSYSNLLVQPEDLPDRLESGTINLPGIAGLSAGIDFIKNTGIERIYKHETELCNMLADLLKKDSNFTLYGTIEKTGFFAPVVSFNLEGFTSMEVADFLSKDGVAVRAGLHCSPLAHQSIGTLESGTVRVSPSFFNTKSDIYALSHALNSIKKRKNIRKNY